MLGNRFTTIAIITLMTVMSFGAFVSPVVAEPAPTINYQGKLTGLEGSAVSDGTYNMRFWLLQSQVQATTSAVWTEELTGSNKVQVTDGLFSVMLGSTTPLTSVNFNQMLYLGVEIGGSTTPAWDGEMSPRKILGTVPAAFEAYQLGGVSSSSFLRSDTADTASGLLTFTGGFISSASSSIANFNFGTATGTTLNINGESFTDFTGAGLINSGGVLSVSSSSLNLTLEGLTDVSSMTETLGDLLYWNGSAWADLATSSLNIALDDTTGTLGVTRGGTGITSISTGGLLYGDGANSIAALSIGSAGQILQISGGVPTWAATSSLGFLENTFGVSIDPSELSAVDFGSFTCNGATCSVNTGGVTSAMLLDDTIDFTDISYLNTLATNPAFGANETFFGSTGILFEGSSADNFEGLLTISNITGSDKTWTLPNTTGTIALTTSTMTGPSTGTFDGNNFAGGAIGTGDILYGSAAGSISELAAVATGNVLISGGVSTAPAWGKVDLTTHVSGTLAATNGGTGLNTTTANQLLIGGAGDTWSQISTSSLGLGNRTFLDLTDTIGSFNTGRLLYESGSAITDSSALTFNGSRLSITGSTTASAGYFMGTTPVLTGNTVSNSYFMAGASSLSYTAGALNNYALGSNALKSLTSGDSNFAVGISALTNNTTGSENIAVGSGALTSNTAGSGNTSLGTWSLFSNTLGSHNTAIGPGAMVLNTVGSNNNTFGLNALAANTTGSYNTVIGKNALGLNNGTGTIAIGYQTANNALSVDRSIFLGYDIDAFSTTADDVLNIGNLLFGNGLDGRGTTFSTGNIGIGTSSPYAKLTIAGDIGLTGGVYDNNYTRGAVGQILQTTGTGVQWVATSSLGLGGGGASALEDLSDVASMTENLGDLLYWNGSAWANIATSSLGISAGDTIITVAANDTPVSEKNNADYVADGTDDEVEIQAALDSLPSTGGTVQLLSGTFHVGTTTYSNVSISVNKSNTALIGKGLATILRLQDNSDGGTSVITMSDAQRVLLRDFVVDGNRANNVSVGTFYGIAITGVSSSTIDNLIIRNAQDSGLIIVGGSRNTISNTISTYNGGSGFSFFSLSGDVSNNTLTNITSSYNTVGITMDGTNASSKYNRIINSKFFDNTTIGISIIKSTSTVIDGNTIKDSGTIGIYGSGLDKSLISNNIMVGNGSGAHNSIYLTNSDDNVISNNVIDSTDSVPLINIVQAASERNHLSGNKYINPNTTSFVLDLGTATTYDEYNRTTITTRNTVGYDLLSVSGSTTAAATAVTQLGTGNIFILSNTSGRVLTVDNSGYVGIGTSSPASKLSVAGDVWLDSNIINLASSSAASLVLNYNTISTSTILNNSAYAWTLATSTTATPIFRIDTSGSNPAVVLTGGFDVNNGAISYDATNNETSIENLRLGNLNFADDAGVVSWIDMNVTSASAVNTYLSYSASIDSNPLLTVYAKSDGAGGITGGAIGIGTTSPDAKLTIHSEDITTATLLSLFQTTSSFDGTGLEMNFGNGAGDFSSTTSKYLDFKNGGNSVFTVSAYGTTTIGDGTTQAGLQIMNGGLCVDNGSGGGCSATTTGRITGVEIQTGNSDLAEMYFSSTDLEPGEIVTLSGGLSIDRAEKESETPIIGVVSTKPGLLLGFDDTSLIAGERGYPVALAGRVPVKLSTENGPINKGDSLMLSSLPGVAMKAKGTGVVVGTALEDFDEDRMYSETFINQFGDDMVDPVFAPVFTDTDPRLQDDCYFEDGVSARNASCVPLVSTSTEDQIEEVNEIIERQSVAEALAELAEERSETVYLSDGTAIKLGQVVMFVRLSHRWADESQLASLGVLLGTSSLETIGENEDETIFDRLVALANNFVDGVLSIFEIKTNRIEVAEELCIDGVCIKAADLQNFLDNSTDQEPGNGTGGSTGGLDTDSVDTSGTTTIPVEIVDDTSTSSQTVPIEDPVENVDSSTEETVDEPPVEETGVEEELVIVEETPVEEEPVVEDVTPEDIPVEVTS
ncbi:right-handed parallel beta-helix repeat-containing protein [Candidatus Nomurabacteria bacterium]|nr:right-handed parallel beta-helix repeat-containing protein [Candidatus Nomurabacteria bacterium]